MLPTSVKSSDFIVKHPPKAACYPQAFKQPEVMPVAPEATLRALSKTTTRPLDLTPRAPRPSTAVAMHATCKAIGRARSMIATRPSASIPLCHGLQQSRLFRTLPRRRPRECARRLQRGHPPSTRPCSSLRQPGYGSPRQRRLTKHWKTSTRLYASSPTMPKPSPIAILL